MRKGSHYSKLKKGFSKDATKNPNQPPDQVRVAVLLLAPVLKVTPSLMDLAAISVPENKDREPCIISSDDPILGHAVGVL